MKKIFTIAKWELIEKLRKRSFFVFMILFPVIIIILSMIPTLFLNSEFEGQVNAIGIIDKTGRINPQLIEKQDDLLFIPYNFTDKSYEQNFEISLNDLETGVTKGVVIIDLMENRKYKVKYISADLSSESSGKRVLLLIENSILRSKLNDVRDKISIKKSYVNLQSDKNKSLSIFVKSFVFLILLITSTLTNGGTFARGFVEEKNSSIMEIIISSCPVSTLFYGKLVGIVLVGLVQIVIWFGAGLLFANEIFLPISMFSVQLIFFILGYLLYASLFLGAGSFIKSEYEAQQLTTLISIILIIPLLLSFYILIEPNSLLATILTYFPLTTVPVMLIKLSGDNYTITQLVITLFIVLSSIFFIINFSSKMYISSYSKGNLFNIRSSN